MPNMTVIRDMVVELTPFWQKVKAITPYVISDGSSLTAKVAPTTFDEPIPTASLSNIHEELHHADNCIMCGACLSVCATHEVSPRFLGPAALAKAYRFIVDPRDQMHRKRLESLQDENGIWDCVRCNLCVSVCPKEVAPMDQIVRLRRLSIMAGLDQTIAARHITQFLKIVGREGRLNETMLPLQMIWGHWKKMFRMIPLGIKMFLRGKTPFPLKRHEGYEKVQRIFEKRGQ
jgi:succinate dehydrogenase / fumarate reductase iron-sulfur subunit